MGLFNLAHSVLSVQQNEEISHRLRVPEIMFSEQFVGGKQLEAFRQLDALLLGQQLVIHRLVYF